MSIDPTPQGQGGTQTLTKPEPAPQKPKQPWLWNVVLIDSDQHTYEYVMRMMQSIFHHPLERAYKIARAVDGEGRGVCLTTHKEHAELKRDQVIAFGRDPLMAHCKGSMHAVIEPAWDGGDGDKDEQDKEHGDANAGR